MIPRPMGGKMISLSGSRAERMVELNATSRAHLIGASEPAAILPI